MGFLRQEYWGGLPFPLPGDLPDPGIKLTSLALTGWFFTTEPLEALTKGEEGLTRSLGPTYTPCYT